MSGNHQFLTRPHDTHAVIALQKRSLPTNETVTAADYGRQRTASGPLASVAGHPH